MKARQCAIPVQCRLASTLNNADFADAYAVDNALPQRTAMEIWLDTVQRTPVWIERAMDLRNNIVKRLGLKDLGRLSALSTMKAGAEYRVGDRIGIFTVCHVSPDEIVLGDSDKHLDVKLSLLKQDAGRRVVLTTVVHIHNTLGRVYMVFVKPMHRWIAPAVLSRI